MKIVVDQDEITPLVETIVTATLARTVHHAEDDRIAYTEPEAAALLGLASHVLRDARLRGLVKGSRVGKRVLYSRSELFALLRRTEL